MSETAESDRAADRGARLGLTGIVAGTAMAGVAYAGAWFAAPWAPWLLAPGAVLAAVSFMALGAARDGSLGRGLAVVLVCTLLGLCVGFALLLSLPEPTAGDPLFLGLPLPSAIMVYGVGLLPYFVIPVAYAVTFRDEDAGTAGGAGRRGVDAS